MFNTRGVPAGRPASYTPERRAARAGEESRLHMVWQAEVEEIRRRRAIARGMGGEEAVARHRAAGKLTVRERIDRLVDPGSFAEMGMLSAAAEYDEDGALRRLTPSNSVMGTGSVDGRRVVVGGEDFTIRG